VHSVARFSHSQQSEDGGVVELEDEEVLQFIERSEAANTVGKTRSDQNTW
jgi:hypothetical protein